MNNILKKYKVVLSLILSAMFCVLFTGCGTTLPPAAQEEYKYLVINDNIEYAKLVEFLQAYNEYQVSGKYKNLQNMLADMLRDQIEEGGESLYIAEDTLDELVRNNLIGKKDILRLRKLIDMKRSEVTVTIQNKWDNDVYVEIAGKRIYINPSESGQTEIKLSSPYKKSFTYIVSSDNYFTKKYKLEVVGGYSYVVEVQSLKKRLETIRKYIGKIKQSDDAEYIKFEMVDSLPVVESKVNNEKFVFNDEYFMSMTAPVLLDVMFPAVGNLDSRLKEEANRPSMQLMSFINSPVRIIVDSGLETLSGVEKIAYTQNVVWYYPLDKGYTSVEYIIKADYANENHLSDFVKALINNSLSQIGVSDNDKSNWMTAIDKKEYLASFMILTPQSRLSSISNFDWNKINYLKYSGVEYTSEQGKPRVSFAMIKNDGSLVFIALENRMKIQ
jgi:hypothetical protein